MFRAGDEGIEIHAATCKEAANVVSDACMISQYGGTLQLGRIRAFATEAVI
jgi:hypothetical protein